MNLLGDTTVFRNRGAYFVVLILLLFEGTPTFAQWPFVRGDARATGVASSRLPNSLEILWKHTVADSGFEATAIVVDGTVYVGDVDGTFYALRLADGEVLWEKKFADSGFLAAAAVVDGRIFVGDFNGVVRTLQADSGEEIWSQTVAGEVYAAPNVFEGQVLVTTESGELHSLDAKTGERRWQFKIEAPLRCWPLVVEDRVLLAGCDQRLHVVDVNNGKELAGVDIDGPTGSTPALFEGHVFFGTEMGTLYSISTSTLAIRWEYQNPKSLDAIRTAATVDHRTLVYSSLGKQVFALNPSTGKLQWKYAVRSNVESSPIISDDRVLLATKRGRLYALNLTTGKEGWKYEAGGSFLASPSVADGRLIIGNLDGTLYCFGKKE